MRRKVSWCVPLLLAVLATACQAAIIRAPGAPDEPDEPTPDDVVNAAVFFSEEVEPILVASCGSCHENAGQSAGAVFLEPANYYASVLAWEGLVTPGDPTASELVTKGEHAGPAFAAGDAATVATWIEAEGLNDMPPDMPVDPEPPRETGPFAMDEGVQMIPLDDVGLPGSFIEFTASYENGGVNFTMRDVYFNAGGGGLVVTNPRFVIHDDDMATSWDDSSSAFEDRSVRVSAGNREELARAHVLANFPNPGSISVRFDSVQPMSER